MTVRKGNSEKRATQRSRRAKATGQPRSMVQQSHGGALLAGGVVGHVGGSGRPPAWLREKCEEILAREETWVQVIAIMHDKNHPMFVTMWKAVADRAAGKPKEVVESKGELTVRVVYSHE